MPRLLTKWTVDYGDGPRPATVPHAWGNDVPVAWEGPATYRCSIALPPGPRWLVFRGVSYAATVAVQGVDAQAGEGVFAEHRGIWEPFSLDLTPIAGRKVDIEVRVVKNGGPTYPVREVLSGFLPYVFHTFGGIFGEVELVESVANPLAPRPPATPRASARGSQVWIDGRPAYLRGLLHWGWYPEIGHPNPDEATIRREVRAAKALGFNLVKFCLWAPPERYLEILHEEGMFAWVELPLWDPVADSERLAEMADEIERIARRLAPCPAIVLWTVGCELSAATPFEFRRDLVERIRKATGGALVKDNSGGAEMYGGDPREEGDFDDFHPYCDLPFYADVLDSLLPGPRTQRPTLLGEFDDFDVHRDLPRLARELPYWASADPSLNDQGVRWQHDLPGLLSNWTAPPPNDEALREVSRRKALFVRKTVQEEVRARDAYSGYVVTGWRDTPISTSGFFDDWGEPRFAPEELACWNGRESLFVIPRRRPPWVRGGNRPGWEDPFNHFFGPVFTWVGVHSEAGGSRAARWRVVDAAGVTVAGGEGPAADVEPLRSTQVLEAWWEPPAPGAYTFEVEWGKAANSWPMWVVPAPNPGAIADWALHDPGGRFAGLELGGGPNLVATEAPSDLIDRLAAGARIVLFEGREGLVPMPFWRESVHLFEADLPALRAFGHHWPRWFPICPDAALDQAWHEQRWGVEFEPVAMRLDTRTYWRHPYVMQAGVGLGELVVASLRPEGGLGRQPSGLLRSPSGWALLSGLMGNLPPG